MKRAWSLGAVIALAAAGCGPDSVPFQIDLVLERGDNVETVCEVDSCENIPMGCDVTVKVEVVDAADESITYLTRCELIRGGQTTLCDIGGVDLGETSIPNRMVRIFVAVWPMAPGANAPKCDNPMEFTVGGEPNLDVFPAPAIGGASYFEVGSSAVAEVVLGCVNLPALDDDECLNPGLTHVTAGVTDFDTGVFVSPTSAVTLGVVVGEPRLDTGSGAWLLDNDDAVSLARTTVAPVPQWSADVDVEFDRSACIQVTEAGIQTTSVLSCRGVSGVPGADLDLGGVLVSKSALDQIGQALGGDLPSTGVVLGRVLDSSGQPAAGVTITPSEGSVLYLSDDMTSASSTPPTTSSGAFLSLDAPFDALWSAQLGVLDEVEPVTGGRVVGKVTVVQLELEDPPTAAGAAR